MTICFVCYSLFPSRRRGGVQQYILRLARALRAAGEHEVHIVTDEGGAADDAGTLPGCIHRVPARWFPLVGRWLPGLGESLCLARAVRQLDRKHGFDVIEFTNWDAPGLAYNFHKRKPTVTRIVTSLHETVVLDSIRIGLRERFQLWSERTAVRTSTRLVTHTRNHRATAARQLGVNEQSITVIPLGLEMPSHMAEPAPPGDDTIRLLYVGRLENRKGTIDLLRALPRVIDQFAGFHLTMVGVDRTHAPGGRTFKAYVEAECAPEVRQRITFTGPVPDDELDRCYRECDLLVAPSLYESFGLIYIEAMRYGKPVIGCRVGGVPEVVRDGETGLLVEPSSPDELAAAMLTLLRDRDLRLRMGAQAYAWTKANFSIELMATRMLELYRDCVARQDDAGY